MKLSGIGASNGIVIAKVFELSEPEINIIKKSINDIEGEILKLKKAIKICVSQIEDLKEKSIKNIGLEHAMIFDAHIQVASDPMMMEEIESLIRLEKVNSDYAVNSITKKYIEMFSQMDDEYMKERAGDIKDVAKRIIYAIFDIKPVDLTTIDEDVIIVAYDLTPSETSQLNKNFVKGFVTDIGGKTSHSAIMARSLEIPAVLGLKDITKMIKSGDILAINGETGDVFINPSKEVIENYKNEAIKNAKEKEYLKTFKDKKSISKDGIQIDISANIGSPKDMEGVIESGADSVGLFRSEFLYMDNENWPTEEEQFKAYSEVIKKNNGKLVIIRTLDIGGDKTLKYFKFPEEMNPFLGYRAIRLCLDKVDIFETQLRALIRASEFGKLGIMFPMIATVDEFKQAKAIFDKVYLEVKKEYKNVSDEIQVGTMVEIPSLAVTCDIICKYADFVSIGTNDLMQYSMASDRMNEKVSYLYQPLNPAILRLIKMTIDGAHKAGKWVGMCGEMAGDISVIPLLFAMGLDEFSMASSSILKARELISRLSKKEITPILDKILNSENEEQVIEILKTNFKFLTY
ncbi:MAG: phosphoenolpyruvate--protein phosphotransferase [Metamycoplasmataceae bacterium]